MAPGKVVCITGIDTDIGKTIATGLIARGAQQAGKSVITQKLVQTGCVGLSEDIVKHREMMGVELLAEDHSGLTCSYVFTKPCSPHLAARLEKKTIDCNTIRKATQKLIENYDLVLVEGAGGLFVPLNEDYMIVDYFSEGGWPVILVSSSRLGSLNHTIASIEALKSRNLPLSGVVYNRYIDSDEQIAEDSLKIIKNFVAKYDYHCPVIEMYGEGEYSKENSCLEFSTLCGLI